MGSPRNVDGGDERDVGTFGEHVFLRVPAMGLRIRFDASDAMEVGRALQRAARMLLEPPRPGRSNRAEGT